MYEKLDKQNYGKKCHETYAFFYKHKTYKHIEAEKVQIS